MTPQPDLSALFGSNASTFMGIEACTDPNRLDAPVALIGAPCASPYRAVGAYCRHAPDALRAATAALAANLWHHDFDLGGPLFPSPELAAVDCGNLPFDESDAAGNRAIIRDAIRVIRSRGAVPITVGGDDSVPIPVLEAFGDSTGSYTVLQLDAHIDWRDEYMGERQGLSSTMRRASEMEHVERLVQIGARSIGSARPQDYRDALDWGVSFVTGYELHRRGVEAALELIPQGSNIIVTVDADVMDPALVPGVIGRCPGGLSYYQMTDLIRGAAARGRIAAMNFVEFMPERDVAGVGALNFSRLITTAMGVLVRQAAHGR